MFSLTYVFILSTPEQKRIVSVGVDESTDFPPLIKGEQAID